MAGQPPHARGRAQSEARLAAAERSGITSLGNGDVLIAAITSCTNTSNPSVLLAAGLLAKKAVAAGLKVAVAHQDLARAGFAHRHRIPHQGGLAARTWRSLGIQRRRLRLHDLHRQLRATSGRNSTTRSPKNDLVCAAVLSGNRNFEARIHPNIKANFPGQPPAGGGLCDRRYRVEGSRRPNPWARGRDGRDVYLVRDLADQRGGAMR